MNPTGRSRIHSNDWVFRIRLPATDCHRRAIARQGRVTPATHPHPANVKQPDHEWFVIRLLPPCGALAVMRWPARVPAYVWVPVRLWVSGRVPVWGLGLVGRCRGRGG